MNEGQNVIPLINNAPIDERDLPGYFESLREEQLAKCWVACIADAILLGGGVGHITRGLIVVARRLHGLRFEEVLMDNPKVNPAHTTAVPASTVRAKPAIPPEGDGEPEIQIHTTEAPQPKKGAVRNPEIIRLVERLIAAPVGAWLQVPESVAKYTKVSAVLRGLHKSGLHKGIVAYRDGAGRSIVKKEK